MFRDFAKKNEIFQFEQYVNDDYTGVISIIQLYAYDCRCWDRKNRRSLYQRSVQTENNLSKLAAIYIEIFFKHHVLYIAITDGVDSLTRQKMDITPFKKILTDR